MNRKLISEVRPGVSYESLRPALGEKWRPLPPKALGHLFGHDLGEDFSLRLDKAGIVGEISFYRNFPAKYTFDGLELGCPLAHAQELFSDLSLDSREEFNHGKIVESYSVSRPTGFRLRFRSVDGTIKGIDYVNPEAKYEETAVWTPSPEGFYPQPQGPAGAPFLDPNFKLAVLGALLLEKKIDLGSRDELAEHVLKRLVDFNDEPQGLIPEVADYLYRYPIAPALLDSVERIDWDGGNEIYSYIFPHWDGETDEFNVVKVDVASDLQYLPQLREINGISSYAWTEADKEFLAARGITLKNSW